MPRVITLQGEQPSTALARIPGSTPTTHIPPSQFGQSLREFTMPRIEFEQSAQRALPPARTENIAPAKVAAPEPEAWSSKAAPGQIPRVSRSLGEAKAEHERSLQERLRRKR